MSIFKQRNIGSWWGGVKQSVGQLSIYVSFINLVLIMIVAWDNTLSDWLLENGIAIPFWVFALSISVLILVALLFEHKISMPSFFSYWNSQFWAHDNPIKKELDEMKEQLKTIEDKIDDKKS